MNVHDLIDCETPEAAQALFTETVMHFAGHRPSEIILGNLDYWWRLSQFIDSICQGELLLRTINGHSEITRIESIE